MILANALRILYPTRCPGCGSILTVKTDKDRIEHTGNPYICEKCYAEIDFLEGRRRCRRCSKPLEKGDRILCPDCAGKSREFTRGVSMMLHGPIARSAIYDIKYNDLKCNAAFLGAEAARRLGKEVASFGAEVMIPVPLGKKRQRERGYNQAEVLARAFRQEAEKKGIKLPPIDAEYLARVKATKALKEMSGAERREAVSGAFAVKGRPGKYKRVLVIDDIFTTGSTISECAKALKAAGAQEVFFMTFSIGS